MAQPVDASGQTETASAKLLQLLRKLESAGEEENLGLEELSKICSQLKEVGEQWLEIPVPEETFDRLGLQLEKFPDAQQEGIITAFAPLRENVRRRMTGVTSELNRWLEQAPRVPAEKLAELFQGIDDAPQMRWYKQCSDLDTKVRFLVAIATAIRAAQDNPMLRGFVGSHPETLTVAQRLTSRFFTLPEFGNILSVWLDARLAVYNETWQRAAELAVAKCKERLQDSLGTALSKAVGTRSIQFVKIAEWPMARCPLAREFVTFTAQHKELLGDLGQPSLADCPPHSLRPSTLLHLFRLLEDFAVDDSIMPLGSVAKKVAPQDGEDTEEVVDGSVAGSAATDLPMDPPTDTEVGSVAGSAATDLPMDPPTDTEAVCAAEPTAPNGGAQDAAESPAAAAAASATAPQPLAATEAALVSTERQEPGDDDYLSVAVPPPATDTSAQAAEKEKAKKAQMLGFEAPVKVPKQKDSKRSLVGGSTSLSMAPLGGDLISAGAAERRKIDWTNFEFLMRLVRRGLRSGDEDWKRKWEAHCEENQLPASFTTPPSPNVLTVFVERNLLDLLRKDWATDLMYKKEGETDEPPANPHRDLSEEPATAAEGDGTTHVPSEDDAARKGSRSRDGSSSSSSNSDASGEKKNKKRKKEENAQSEKDKVLEQLENRLPPADYKTRMCGPFLDGKCNLAHCNLAHTQGELMKTNEASAIIQARLDKQQTEQDELQKKQQEEAPKEQPKKESKPAKRAKANPHDPYYKTAPCAALNKGQCQVAAKDCFFAHAQEELRMTPEATMHMQQMGGWPPMGYPGMMPGMIPNQMMGMSGLGGMPLPGMGPMMSHPGQMPMPPPGGRADGKKKEKKRDDKDDKGKKRKDKKEDKEKEKDKDKRKDRDKEKGKEKKEKGSKEKDRGKEGKEAKGKQDKKEKRIDADDV